MSTFYLDQAPVNQTQTNLKFLSIDALQIKKFSTHGQQINQIANQAGNDSIVFKAQDVNVGCCVYKDNVFGNGFPGLIFRPDTHAAVSSIVNIPPNCTYVLAGVINNSRYYKNNDWQLGIVDICNNVILCVSNRKSDCLLLVSDQGVLQIPFEYGLPFILIIKFERIPPNLANVTVYLNGRVIISTTVYHTSLTTPTRIRIHSDGIRNLYSYFSMVLANFSIYPTLLSDSDCYQIFTSLNTSYNMNVSAPSLLLRGDFSILQNYAVDLNRRLIKWVSSVDFVVYFFTYENNMDMVDILNYLYGGAQNSIRPTLESIKKFNNLFSDTVPENTILKIPVINYELVPHDTNLPAPIKDNPSIYPFFPIVSGYSNITAPFDYQSFFFDKIPIASISLKDKGL